MQFTQALIALLASSSLAAAAPRFSKRQSSCSTTYGCAFEITVAGCTTSQLVDGQVRVANSSISEISDGQARCDLNGTTPTNFTLTNGQVTDSAGRVCEISNQDQFQCSAVPDTGATTTGFSVCNGLLAFNGNSSFIACLATGAIPGYNIYTAAVDRSTVTDCMAIELDVPSCAVSSSSCVASTVVSTVLSTVTPAAVTVTATTTATLPAVTDTVVDTITNTVTSEETVVNTVTAVTTATSEETVVNTVTAVTTATLPAKTVTDTVTATATATLPASTVTSTVTDTNTVTSVQSITVAQTVVDTVTVTPVVKTTTAAKTTSAAQATCTNITRALGSSNFPTTIEVVNESSDVSGSSYFGYIGSGNSTIFTFNSVGSSGECSVSFYFPTEAEIVAAGGTTSYDISSSSIAVTLYELDSVAAVTDTYATKPARGASFSATLTPGTNTTFTTLTCPSSQASYELVADDSNTLSFFEDYNLPVLGLVVASC